ncbi:MAG: 1-acyl-sn-glycerol-3-phosphate acyltransferase [Alphaproteobacteria bacterium]|nr:1-acyl-sn-glycerol-3-phosphate acyltransferase [Alphaproteobacteria bacterium]
MTALRPALFMSFVALLTLLMGIVFAPTLLMGRRHAQGGLRLWSRLVLLGLRAICGVRHEIRGLDRLPAGPVLIASKHMSMWDTVIFPCLLSDPAFILKKELMAIPIYGWYAGKLGMIPIDRAGHMSALKAMVREARGRVAEGRSIVIFPEGTRVPPGAPADIKPGVVALYRELGIPCVPVALTSGLHWSADSRRFTPGTIRLSFGAPIAPGLARKPFTEALADALDTGTSALLAEAGHAPATAAAPRPKAVAEADGSQ